MLDKVADTKTNTLVRKDLKLIFLFSSYNEQKTKQFEKKRNGFCLKFSVALSKLVLILAQQAFLLPVFGKSQLDEKFRTWGATKGRKY